MCSKLLKVFSILVVVFFVLSVTCVSSNAVFYEEDSYWLLETAGVYGGYYIYIRCSDLYNAIDTDELVLWIPVNYLDNFSSDDNSLVNISSSTLSIRGYDFDHNVHTIRFPAYSYPQIRTDTSPYYYYDLEYLEVVDTNIQIQGEDSPFFNANIHWSYDTKMICLFLGIQTIFLILVGVFHDKSRR